MIKIENTNLEKFAKEYFDDIKELIKLRSDYLVLMLNVLFYGESFTKLESHVLHWRTKNALTNRFLKRTHKLTNTQNYSNVNELNCLSWVKTHKNRFHDIANYLNNYTHIEDIILCTPDEAIVIENRFKSDIGITTQLARRLKRFINIIIDYSLFYKFAYNLARKLNVNTCPYCNRNYINTIIDRKGKTIIRPTFDHFFSQKDHPFLSLSFYNLIPSCYYCNSSLKSSIPMRINTHIHPYKEGFDMDATFHVLIKDLYPDKSNPENYTLIFEDNTDPLALNDKYQKIFGGTRSTKNLREGNLNLFKLKEIYQSHLDVVGELIVKCDKLSLEYSFSLESILKDLRTNQEEFYQYYFNNYFNEKDFNRRPLAKLTKDIILQIAPYL